jgi:hypothetical protein
MHTGKDYLYLLTPIDGSSEESQTFEESFDFAEFPEVIRGIEKDLSNEEEDLERLSRASTFFNSPVDKLVSTSYEKQSIGFNSPYFASETERKENIDNICEKLQFNITLRKENKQIPPIPNIQRRKKIKTRHFMKKNWLNKLTNFKENRLRKLVTKVNSLLVNKINQLPSSCDEIQVQGLTNSINNFNQINKMTNFNQMGPNNSTQGICKK